MVQRYMLNVPNLDRTFLNSRCYYRVYARRYMKRKRTLGSLADDPRVL